VQTVHILAVAAVMSSILMVDLRLIGVRARSQSVVAVAARFIPVVWYGLAHSSRDRGDLDHRGAGACALQNPVFILKMTLVLLAAGLTLACQIPLRRDQRILGLLLSRRRLARLVACLSLPIWVAIVFAGRWIAYVRSH
jgi:hypothetical protein